VLKDFFNHVRLVDETDDAHLPLALGAGKRIGLIDFPDEVGPSFDILKEDSCFIQSIGYQSR
jgi:hypothetical protein